MSDETLDMSIVGVLQRIKKPGFFPNLINVYEEDSKRILDVIKSSIDGGDAKALEESAHSLKSASSSIGAARVAEVASALEKMGESGSFDGAAEQWEELSKRLLVSHEALKALVTED
jgi:HPt (histidine-containing phosphotransfer) domain-containing protein